MQRCLQLATNGQGNVAPNPLVGALVVHQETIIGEGYHIKFGGPHAEVNAINAVVDKDLLKQSTLYVNLEPCSHFGKTPPCASLIVEMGIPLVVIGMQDPFADVNGNGIAVLKKAGVEVICDVLKAECQELNKRFVTFHTKKRPYIILKWAQTRDGFIDKERTNDEAIINWITDEHTRLLVHKWRAEEQAIITGTNTIMKDNPQLTVRDWAGNNPLRLIIDKDLKISLDAKVFSQDANTIVFNATRNLIQNHIEFVMLDFSLDILPQIMSFLYNRNMQSLIVEGGRILLQSCIDADLWDEARIFSGNTFFFKGTKAPEIVGTIVSTETIGKDSLCILRNC